MPHSGEMPAPVKGTMHLASAIMLPSCSTPLCKSLAITADVSKRWGGADYSTAIRIARSQRALHAHCQGGRDQNDSSASFAGGTRTSDNNVPKLILRDPAAAAVLTIRRHRFRIHAPFARANDGDTRISNRRMGDDGEGRTFSARPGRNRSPRRELQ